MMENHQNTPRKENKNQTYWLIGIAAILVLGSVLYFFNRKKEEKAQPTIAVATTNDSTRLSMDSLQTDSIKKTALPGGADGGDEEDYEPYSENFVVANEAHIRTAPNEAAPALPTRLRFGNRLYKDNSYSGTGYAKVYLAKPSASNPQTAYYVSDYVLTYQSDFEEYRKYFSLKPFAGLASKTKKIILDNDYSNSRKYYLTQNMDRSKSALCYGDFDADGIQDVAVLLDNNEDQYSRLLVICTNAATKDPYLAYAENFSDKMKVNAFKQGAKVFINTPLLVSAPADGIMINAADAKIAIIYDNKNQKFKTYYQSASEDE